MNIRILILLIVSSFFMFSCGTNETSKKPLVKATKNIKKSANFLPSLPKDRLMNIYENASNLDYIFLNSPISMSMDNRDAIQSQLLHIDPAGVDRHPSCNQHDGNMIFSINGDIVEECYFYFRDDCKYFVWLEKGKPTYANIMRPNGIEFFGNIFSGQIYQQAQQQAQQQGQ